MDQWLSELAKTVAAQGPLFAILVAFIWALGSGKLVWQREMDRERSICAATAARDRELYEEERAENAKLRELIASVVSTATTTISRVERMLDKLER